MPLTRRQLIQLTYAVEARREALREEIRSGRARVREEPYAALAGATHDIGDEAVADLAVDLVQAEVSRDVDEWRALESAISRLCEGTYGVCVDCEADIGFDRLLAQPSAARCVDCQRQQEKRSAEDPQPSL